MEKENNGWISVKDKKPELDCVTKSSGYQFNEKELSRMYRWAKIYDKSKYLTRYECQQIGKRIDDFLLQHPLSEKLENHLVKKLTDAGLIRG
ncbi:hypothetical protein AP518_00558 [Actinobacillus pleuropneumoniae]|nr:hypothetical protein AP1022_02585 [Actinobacillus pleuropneumoniae]KIE92213.1 hypothetical protein AP518_00558 [Actinobacillus pleuropneumoniae]KIE97726.1 hypothetical protein AP5651_00563 [Actinobacillus pleuropneumoniae]